MSFPANGWDLGAFMLDGQRYDVEATAITVAGGVTTELAVGQPGKVIRVVYAWFGAAAAAWRFKSASSSLGPQIVVAANATPPNWPPAPKWVETAAGEALSIQNLSGSGAGTIAVGWVVLPA